MKWTVGAAAARGKRQGVDDCCRSATSSTSSRSTARPATIALRQLPEIEGALVAMDPHTGRVLAMVGGFSFAESEFNRATQA